MIAEERVSITTDNELLNLAVAALEDTTNLDFINFVDKVTDYCVENENGKVFDQWDRKTLRQLIAYHQVKGTLIVLNDSERNIAGVYMWYNSDKEDGWSFVYNWEEDKPRGDTIFMAFLFSSTTQALKKLVLKFIEKEPDCLHKSLVGSRHRHGEPTKISYKQNIFTKLLKLKD